MNYKLVKEVIDLVEVFQKDDQATRFTNDLNGFKKWIHQQELSNAPTEGTVSWEGKENGRSSDGEISTLLVHLNRYAKTYSRSVINDSDFSTQEEFIYLINLNALGEMSKTELIKMNVQEKPAGMQIINRLISQGWVKQLDSTQDKRSKIISITSEGVKVLAGSMEKIRLASQVVAGNLTETEKMHLIRLLQKLDEFHEPIYAKNIAPSRLLDEAAKQLIIKKSKNENQLSMSSSTK